eukprot:764740-Hanusia_phi.AAC.2
MLPHLFLHNNLRVRHVHLTMSLILAAGISATQMSRPTSKNARSSVKMISMWWEGATMGMRSYGTARQVRMGQQTCAKGDSKGGSHDREKQAKEAKCKINDFICLQESFCGFFMQIKILQTRTSLCSQLVESKITYAALHAPCLADVLSSSSHTCLSRLCLTPARTSPAVESTRGLTVFTGPSMATEWQDRPQRHSVLACCAADLCLIQTWSRRAMEREMMEDDSSDDDRIHGKRAQGLAQENPPEDKFCVSISKAAEERCSCPGAGER